MAVDDRMASGECRREPLSTSNGTPGIVNHPDPHAADLHDASLWQLGEQLGLVHVSGDGFDRGELTEPIENRSNDDVARVEDQLGALQATQTLLR